MTFYVSVRVPGIDGMEDLECKNKNNCKIIYKRDYTPRVYYLSPPVVYYEAYTEVWFDPKSTMNVIQNLKSSETPFVAVELAGSKMDFEDTVNYETTFSNWWDNRVRG